MPLHRLLIANRGEIAIRIQRAAADLGIEAVTIYSDDDEPARHRRYGERSLALGMAGPAAYLNGARIIELARESGCDSIHPGYGFLSENADFAAAVAGAGLVFVGPRPELLRLFGDKQAALERARELGIPTARGTSPDADLTVENARAFLEQLQSDQGDGAALLVKAVAGGGGRGMRLIRENEQIEEALSRCRSEAQNAFGDDRLYAEEFIARARHVEVQIVGDGQRVVHLGERECSLQRRHQKLMEIAPAPDLDPAVRERLTDAAVRLGEATDYNGPGTIEFLVRASAFLRGTSSASADEFIFIEANPRLQVEHTVTEAVTGLDLVALQLRLAGGAGLSAIFGDDKEPGASPADARPGSRRPLSHAIQLRVNTETYNTAGDVLPATGKFETFDPPAGPGVRVDTHGETGYEPNPAFDSLLAKVIVTGPPNDFAGCLARARRALSEFRVQGCATNIAFLDGILARPDLNAELHTRFIDEHLAELIPTANESRDHSTAFSMTANYDLPPGGFVVTAPMAGRLLTLEISEGEPARAGQDLFVIEAMKMENAIQSEKDARVLRWMATPGANVAAGDPLLIMVPAETGELEATAATARDPNVIRPDLQEVLDRHAMNMDAARPRAVAKRHKRSQRTARENIDDLCDPGSFQEYGALALAAQRRRRELDELLKLSPADGLVAGTGRINGDLFEPETARAAMMAYDYTVFAGTQGAMNHKKTDRLFHVVEDLRLPFVLFAEGGGGRPGDVDVSVIAGLDLATFRLYAGLSGLAPRIAIASGRCFAGNAALFGASDITIATRDSTIGMGGPVMIKGGGLGNFRAEEVGPSETQARNGVIDVLVDDEAAATRAARQALSYFQGRIDSFSCADQNRLRAAIPENRLRAYDIRKIIELIADDGSFMELRASFAAGIITALIRVGGRPLGLIANNPARNAGAIDSDGADKAARFMQLCDAFDVPLLTLCDTPGIMVGPEAERTGLVRHAARLFVTAASITIPVFTIVLRKGYGLGAMAMAGGGFHATVFTAAWPTGEFGAMGLEGAVSTGFQKELGAIKDWEERQALFQKLVREAHEVGKALNMASQLEIDAVIDPRDTRLWISRGLESLPPREKRTGKKRTMIDTW